MSAPTLVIGPSWVGDMVMAQSLFKTLRQRRPNSAIDVIAPQWSQPLLARMPEVRTSIDMPLGHGQLKLQTRYNIGKSLRATGYRKAIVLPNSWKSALIPYWARIPRRIGYRGEMRWKLLTEVRPLDKDKLPMTVQRFVNLGLTKKELLPPPVPYPELAVDDNNLMTALERLQLQPLSSPILALCPGAEYGPAKRWPVSHFSEVARKQLDAGWQVWLFGSAKDRAVAAEIQAELNSQCVDLTGKTQLGEAIDLLSLATAVVSNDSGLMHVAAALNCKVIALYGSSDPQFTPPLSHRANILHLNLDCSPCFKRQCPLRHLRCLRDISPNQVLQAISSSQ